MEQERKKKVRKWIIGLAVMLAILFVIVACIDTWCASMLEEKLQEKVSAISNGLYSLRIGDKNVSILMGNVSLDDVQLVPDSGLYKQREKANAAPKFLVTLNIPSIKLSGLRILKAFWGKELIIDDLVITSPQVTIIHNSKKEKEVNEEVKTDLYDILQKYFRETKADRIVISHSEVLYIRRKGKRTTEHLALNVTMSWKDVLINEQSLHDTTLCCYSKDFRIAAKDYAWSLADSNYTVLASRIDVSSRNRIITLDSVFVRPNFGVKDLSGKPGGKSKRIITAVNKVELLQVDLKKLFESKKVNAHLLRITGADVSLYKDKRFSSGIPDNDPMPQQALREFPIPMTLDSLRLENITVAYEEVSREGQGPGKITFDHIYVSAGKISNDKVFLATKPVSKLNVNAQLMNSAKVDLHLAFDLADRNNLFTCNGELKSIQLSLLNRMVENTGVLKFKRGKLDDLRFTATFTETNSTGTLLLSYHDLAAELLDRETGKPGLKEKIISRIARYKVPESNPEDPDEPMRVGKIDYIRNKEKSVFGYFWKSLQTGVLSSLNLEGMAEKVKAEALTAAGPAH